MKNIETFQPIEQTNFMIYRDGEPDKMYLFKQRTGRVLGFLGQSALTVLHETADCIRIVCEGLDEARGLTPRSEQ